ncbi:MAG: nucleoside triphosphate pyrophosphohydrolase [Actinomycetota bacterium]|nr:nucleoside triphosphate pyrophosphohydrolase [Actinomycetota bacterium]
MGVTVVGLGPAGPELMTSETVAALKSHECRFVRTMRHPSAAGLSGVVSFDDVYDSAGSLDEVYGAIVDALAEAAREEGDVLYAVPGAPLVAERTVELLRADDRVDVTLLPALSFLDLVWSRLGVDPVASGVRLVDGQRFGVEAAGERGPLVVAQCDSRQVLSDVKLAVEESDGARVVVLRHLGLRDESVEEVAWEDLDRIVEPDHLTTLYVPELAAPVAQEVARFAELVRELRDRCPWDREQTHQTLTRHLLEETYEVLEAIEALDAADGFAHLEEELGDLLFQVVFHSVLGAEEGEFTLADVARGVHDKLVRRHPHVFGSVEAGTPGEVVRNWEQIKKAEKGHSSLMDGIGGDLPALLYAHKVQRKAASVGLRWDGPLEISLDGEAVSHHEIGAALFAVVDAARRHGIDPEAALRGASASFRARFVAVEDRVAASGADLTSLSPDELGALWDDA